MSSYPKWVYGINEIHTRENMKKVDRMRMEWNAKRDQLFPDFCNMTPKEKYKANRKVDEAIGYSYYEC